eukprot:TRINITY_DN2392_c0_g1_i1.p1 TRINITY_DN2392_c0_g1~~TRINITY_DN2392_c0_g1_i1.p1  ORF type:complete len:501 (+),score=106.94 TRINITY_DN2392_c0_g1_i1:71-1573(+)
MHSPASKCNMAVAVAVVAVAVAVAVAALLSAPARPVVVVVGGGLAGCASALEAAAAAPASVRVVLLEQRPKLGGNTARATSGVSAAGTAAQRDAGVSGDDAERLAADTLASGAGLSDPALVRVLAGRSVDALSWLQALGVNCSSVIQCGGHSLPRTHRLPPSHDHTTMVGAEIVNALVKAIAATQVTVTLNAQVENVVTKDGRVAGVEYTDLTTNARVMLAASAVVLATGGFSASKSLLRQYVPNHADRPTTNGPWAAGDGLRMAAALGASLVQMDQVQLHPTGLLNLSDVHSGHVLLGPENMRGCGGILVNARGERYVNELTLRDAITVKLLAQNDSFDGVAFSYLLLNDKSVECFGPAVMRFYVGSGLFRWFDNAAQAGTALGIPTGALSDTLRNYGVGGADSFGKRLFPVAFDPERRLVIAAVTPAVHYTMGGVAIDSGAHVLRSDNGHISGLFAAGEVTGGVHGANRLVGNSLLECIVFGRIAGRAALTVHTSLYS